MPEYPLLPSETRGALIYWLLEVTWASRVWRWASQRIEIDGDDGAAYLYDGGLEVRFERRWDFLGSDPANPTVAISGLVFPEGIDVAELIEQGHVFEHAPAELSQWVAGRTYEHRVVRLRGYVTAPNYGAADEPVNFALEPPELRAGGVVPPPEATVDLRTYLSAAEEDLGKPYPRVYGRPGRVDVTVTGLNGGSPARWVAPSRLLVADGWTYRPGGVANVRVINRTALNARTCALEWVVDGLGRKVTRAILTPGGGFTINSGDDYWTRWDTEFGAVGGLPNDANDGPLEGAGEVIVDLLRLAGIPVDEARWAAASDLLDAYRLAFFLDDPKPAWEVIRATILPLLPVGLVHGPEGIYPIVWRADVDASDAVARLVAGEGIERDGLVQYERDQLSNEIRVEYAPRSDNGEPSARVTLTGRDVGVANADVYPVPSARTSFNRYGLIAAEPIATPIIEQRTTAVLVAAWMIAARAHPWRVVTYTDFLGAHAHLRVGDVVLLTDAELHWSEAVCWVLGETWADDVLSLTLLRIDDPARDVRPL